MGLPTVVHYRMKAGAYFEAIRQYSVHPSDPAILGWSRLPFPGKEGPPRSRRIEGLIDRYEAMRQAAFRAEPDGFPARERARAAAAQELAIALRDYGWGYTHGARIYGHVRIGRTLELTRRARPGTAYGLWPGAWIELPEEM